MPMSLTPNRSIGWRRLVVPVVAALVGLGSLLDAAPERAGTESDGDGWSVFATGLTNPRHMRVGPDGHLYVAEAGIGPAPADEPLFATCEPVDNMFTVGGPYQAGYSGRVSRIRRNGERETVVDGLPGAVDGTFFDALGPSDVAWLHGQLYVLIEGGGCSRGLPDDPAGIIRIGRKGEYSYVADISAFIRANPVDVPPVSGEFGDEEPDGVPHSMLAVGNRLLVVETNHNSILSVNPRTGHIERLHDLSVQDPAPTILTKYRNGFLLGSFDGLIDRLNLWFDPPRSFDSGYGPIVELLSIGRHIYVLETFGATTPFTPDTGSVIRRDRFGRRTVIASGLNFPIGMARQGDGLYVSTVSYGQGAVEGLGQIVRIHGR
jgi:hypothetical protein